MRPVRTDGVPIVWLPLRELLSAGRVDLAAVDPHLRPDARCAGASTSVVVADELDGVAGDRRRSRPRASVTSRSVA